MQDTPTDLPLPNISIPDRIAPRPEGTADLLLGAQIERLLVLRIRHPRVEVRVQRAQDVDDLHVVRGAWGYVGGAARRDDVDVRAAGGGLRGGDVEIDTGAVDVAVERTGEVPGEARFAVGSVS